MIKNILPKSLQCKLSDSVKHVFSPAKKLIAPKMSDKKQNIKRRWVQKFKTKAGAENEGLVERKHV